MYTKFTIHNLPRFNTSNQQLSYIPQTIVQQENYIAIVPLIQIA